jgi:K+ transporter
MQFLDSIGLVIGAIVLVVGVKYLVVILRPIKRQRMGERIATVI